MVKQIAIEVYYRRIIDKSMIVKDIFLVLCLLLGLVVMQSPMLVAVVFLLSLCFTPWKDEKTRFTEAMCFVPLSQKEIKELAMSKSNVVAFVMTVFYWISCGILVWNIQQGDNDMGYGFLGWTVEYMIYLGLLMFCFTHYMTLTSEIARMRGVRKTGILFGNYSAKNSLLLVAFFVLFFVLLCWLGMRISFDFENDSVPMIERILILFALVGEYILGIHLEKSLLQELIYSDYNAKITKDEEVDYEY